MSKDLLSSIAETDSPTGGGQEGAFDSILLVDVVLLVGFGLVMLYSSSAVMAAETFDNHLYLLKSQAFKVGIGFCAMIAAMTVHYKWYRRLVYPTLLLAFLLLVAVLVPGIGSAQNGAQRWINVGGVGFQPAEYAKVAVVIFMAYSIGKKGEKMENFTMAFVPHLAVVGALCGLLIVQPDFGTSVILVTMMGIMLFVSGARLMYLSGFGVLGLVGVYYLIVTSPYRMERIKAYLDPWAHRQDIGYQISESLIAIGSGGLTGRGLGRGTGKLGYVPELANDFIATSVGEELGLVGIVVLVGLFVVFVWRGMHIAFRARDAFGRYLAFGLTTLIGIQAAGNLCVVTGLLPPKGLTLPFFSFGGSSILMTMFSVGILLNISKRAPDRWEESREERQRRRDKERWEERRESLIDGRVEVEE